MKITSIKVSAVNIPLIKDYTVSMVGTISTTRSVVVELFTDKGYVGIGETDPELMFSGESQQTVMTVLRHHLGPAILEQSPLDLTALHQRMDTISVGNQFAKAALDLACHDILGKHRNIPVYKLYGELVNDRIEVMWSLGSDSIAANVADAVQKVEEGYKTIGLKVGTLEPKEDIARVQAVRKAVGDAILIRCDANQAWTAKEAIPTIRRMEEYGICMLEQPVPHWDIEGLARVRASVNVPIAVDEGFRSPRDASKLIQAKAADIFSIKTTKLGGLKPSFQAAAVIGAAGLKVFVNSMIEMGISTMSSLNLAAAEKSLFPCGHAMNSVRRLKDDIIKVPITYAGGQIIVPADRPGLGVDLDEKKMKAYTVSTFSLP